MYYHLGDITPKSKKENYKASAFSKLLRIRDANNKQQQVKTKQ
jgi:hypothetical protein